MQFAKEEVRERILKSAKDEFQRVGFEKASIRTIALNAKTSKSNLYNYFEDKDALFCAALEPTVNGIRIWLKIAARSSNLFVLADTYTIESHKKNVEIVLNFIFKYSDEIKILIYDSAGSSLESFPEEVVEQFTDVLGDWLIKIIPNSLPPRFFLRCISNLYINLIEQIITSETSKEQAEKNIDEYIKFVYNGLKGLKYP